MGSNVVTFPHVTSEYDNNMNCPPTTCTCPAGTASVRIRGNYNIEPGPDYVKIGSSTYTGSGTISKTVFAETAILEFRSNEANSFCDGATGYGGMPYTGVQITSIECSDISSILSLDVGNDTIIDLQAAAQPAPIRTRNIADEVNSFVRGGCWCAGCVNTMDGYCLVPVIIQADYTGTMMINDIRMEYYSAQVLANVSYGDNFRRSEGWCWGITDVNNNNHWGICVPIGRPMVPLIQEHFYTPVGTSHPNTNDAIDDAVYRLLNESLDKNQDGKVDIAYDMSQMNIQAEGKIGVQNMWGPLGLRLIVWS